MGHWSITSPGANQIKMGKNEVEIQDAAKSIFEIEIHDNAFLLTTG